MLRERPAPETAESTTDRTGQGTETNSGTAIAIHKPRFGYSSCKQASSPSGRRSTDVARQQFRTPVSRFEHRHQGDIMDQRDDGHWVGTWRSARGPWGCGAKARASSAAQAVR